MVKTSWLELTIVNRFKLQNSTPTLPKILAMHRALSDKHKLWMKSYKENLTVALEVTLTFNSSTPQTKSEEIQMALDQHSTHKLSLLKEISSN
jgi:hypothetical protein